METKVSILFYGKKLKITTKNQLPIYMRVTINQERFEVTTAHYIDAEKWSAEMCRAKGNSEESRNLNSYLDILRQRVYNCQKDMVLEGLSFTKDSLQAKWFGLDEKAYTLNQIIQQHNDKIKALIGKGYTRSTWMKYQTKSRHVKEFLQWKYNLADINIRHLKYEFITSLGDFLVHSF
jgi:hypothetical protein